MGALNPAFLFDTESNMKVLSASEYQRLSGSNVIWWNKICKQMGSTSKKERLIWLLDTAKIERGVEGQITFEDLVKQSTEYEAEFAQAGLELLRSQLDDDDGDGPTLAAQWARQIGAYAAYWPQKELARAIKLNGNTYDALPFFSKDHLLNPFRSSAGTYHNVFTGAASGAYPGAVPIDESVSVEVAVQNIAKVIAYCASIPMPNGEDPRMLRVAGIYHPPLLASRTQQVTKSKFIAQLAGTGSGSADVESMIANFGLGTPVQCDELGSAMGGSDTDYYIAMQEVTSSELGAFTYVNREPFTVLYHGLMDDAELARRSKLQWLTRGRNVIGYGHPYLFFKCRAT